MSMSAMLDTVRLHLRQLQPGMCVLDGLRCRKTLLEILSLPEATETGLFDVISPETGKPISSSWHIEVRDVRANRKTVTRVDCDETGYTNRFHMLANPC